MNLVIFAFSIYSSVGFQTISVIFRNPPFFVGISYVFKKASKKDFEENDIKITIDYDRCTGVVL